MANLARHNEAQLLPNAPAQPAIDTQEVQRLWSAILRHRRLFITVWIAFVLLVGVLTFLWPKSYTTTVRLMAGSPNDSLNNGGANSTDLPILNALVLQSGEQSAETFAQIAEQENVSSQVVKKLNLDTTPQGLLRDVTVKPVVNTAMMNLSVTWRNREGSAQIANAYASEFIGQQRQIVQSQATAAIGFLSDQLPQAERAMNDAQAALANYQAANGFIDAGAHTQDVVARATDLESRINAALLDSREAQALLSTVRQQLASMPPTVNNAQQITTNPVLTDLRTKLESVDVQLANARRDYTNSHPLVISLQRQHDDLTAQIARQPVQVNSGNTFAPNPIYQSLQEQATQYEGRIGSDAAQSALLRRLRKQLTPQLKSLPRQSMQFATLQERAKLTSGVYNSLQQKYNDATIAKTTALSDIVITQEATPESAVARPRLSINLAIGIIVGLLLACVAAFVKDALEHPVRETNQPRVLGLSVIARIPAFDGTKPRMLPWIQSMTIEAFLHLCVTLRLRTKRDLRTLAITSPCRGDGKSTVAFHLAKAMANLEPRVLLIDADMRKPVLHLYAGRANGRGLGNILTGQATLTESVQQITPNLDLLCSGIEVQNPVSLLQGVPFADLLAIAAEKYSMVIVDTPALSSVTDGLLVSARVDGTLLVIAANSTDEVEARRVVTQFSALGIDSVLGVVVTKDIKRMRDYSDYFNEGFKSAITGGPG